jgi:signal transduction histidine kinase/HAMP domain-containing protein
VLSRLRSSFAAKLLTAGLLLALLVVGGVSGYLLISRDQQTRVAAKSNSDNRVLVMRQVLQRFTGEQSLGTARGLASQLPLEQALTGASPATQVPALFAASPPVDLADEVLVITDASGLPLYARASTDLGSVALAPFESSTVIATALAGSKCAIANQPGACGIEVLTSGIPAYSVATPVTVGGVKAGVVAYVAPLSFQLNRFSNLFQFPTAFISAGLPGTEVHQQNGTDVLTTTPAEVAAGIKAHKDLVDAIYNPGSSTEPVAGSYAAVTSPDGHTIAGYVGIEVPLSIFAGDTRTDELTLAVITAFALLVVAILVILFVETFVRRPIRRLERGVARIASGDYTSPVKVRSKDELGRLATSVNSMRDSIRRYTTEIEAAHARLDSAVERVSEVSRALTMTTGGTAALHREVVRAAVAIAGEGTVAMLAVRDGDTLAVKAVHPSNSPLGDVSRWTSAAEVLQGKLVRESSPGYGSLLAVPMFYQDSVVGALAVIAPNDAVAAATDEEDVLAVLANNAAIAMENTRLYEQEKETVRRLRQLDAMKTDFLSTVQHELRTPLTAILGLSDLIDMCWHMWDDGPKLEAVHDIQVAAKNLYDIVETIIDFSAVDGETIDLNPTDLPLADAIAKGVAAVGERYKGGLPIPVDIDVDPALTVYADPDRFEQVVRALVDNAVKFSDGKGRVGVRAGLEADGQTMRIDVIDQGIGISAEDLPRIFDRFYQVDNTATRRYGGTGMGLALVKRLVQAHGAKVSMDTKLGEGTRVVLYWPGSATAPRADVADVIELPEATGTRRKQRRVVAVEQS